MPRNMFIVHMESFFMRHMISLKVCYLKLAIIWPLVHCCCCKNNHYYHSSLDDFPNTHRMMMKKKKWNTLLLCKFDSHTIHNLSRDSIEMQNMKMKGFCWSLRLQCWRQVMTKVSTLVDRLGNGISSLGFYTSLWLESQVENPFPALDSICGAAQRKSEWKALLHVALSIK